MKFSLPNGKVVNVPAKFFSEMSDSEFEEEISNLVSLDMGFETNDIWEDSILKDGEIGNKKEVEIDDDSILPLLDDDLEDYFLNED